MIPCLRRERQINDNRSEKENEAMARQKKLVAGKESGTVDMTRGIRSGIS